MAQAVADAFDSAWQQFARPAQIVPESKPWWSEACQTAFDNYSVSREKEDWSAFRRAVREAKRDFFAERMQEVAVTNMRLWDLMEWVKQRKNPPCEAIQKDGEPCHDLEQLWDALHSTYNAASGRQCDVSMLDDLPDEPVREWAPFSALELREALGACSGNSARPVRTTSRGSTSNALSLPPGCLDVFLTLANACLRVGHWPGHFKDSVSVVIPKPGKPSYSTPKAFRPIVLLNTLGKLIEKMIANRCQFDMIDLDLVPTSLAV